ncbi:Butirosin biosynthesis, BtrG-like protein [Scenedesmus sp. NREL 46B-D3]|nr:Butirosin biosynthesis, BtrG-like protein [Scenedesmus sp. NREL 46B-D3]
MSGTAFVYGTLMAPEVLQLLIKRVPKSRAATLNGYARYRVKEQVFPAIIPAKQSESKVTGVVLMELSRSELDILDVYESEEYYRAAVEPEMGDGSKMTADVYIWKDEYKDQLLLDQPDWDFSGFMAQHLPEYLTMTKLFMQECFPEQQ